MFLIIGISQGEKKLEFSQTIVCPCCGRYGSIEVYMTYMYFSLFFLPLIKWNKKYYVKTTCCRGACGIDRALGSGVKSGMITEINPADLQFRCAHSGGPLRCAYCGYETHEDFQYCPKCGREL